MGTLPELSRRQALGLGAGLLGAFVLARSSVASATTPSPPIGRDCNGNACETYWHGPENPYNEENLGGSSPIANRNLVTNGSFEGGSAGPTAPGWTFTLPPV